MTIQPAIDAFFEESDAHLEVIESSLLALEKKSADPELIDELFRATHSMKGNAGLVGFTDIHQASMEMEQILGELRSAGKPVDQEHRDTLFEFLDKIKGMIVEVRGPTSGGTISAVELEEAPVEKEARPEKTPPKKEIVKKSKKERLKEKRVFLTFMLDKELYGIDITFIKEIILKRRITRVPNTKNYVTGIMNLRGMVVPVIDAKKKLGFQENGGRESQRNIIILEHHGLNTGVLVDSVKDIVTFDDTDISPINESLDDISGDCILGIGNTGKQTVLLLDMDRFCSQSDTYY
ncbi:MAG: chemotaxis protein CheW [Nitrospinota bacterium]